MSRAGKALSSHAKEALRTLLSGPRPAQEFNPGVVSKLHREALVDLVEMPSPYPSRKGLCIQFLRISRAGMEAIEQPAPSTALAKARRSLALVSLPPEQAQKIAQAAESLPDVPVMAGRKRSGPPAQRRPAAQLTVPYTGYGDRNALLDELEELKQSAQARANSLTVDELTRATAQASAQAYAYCQQRLMQTYTPSY